jgi:hypothetical protein
MVDAIGFVGTRDHNVDRAFDNVLKRAPSLAAAVTLARRRLSIGF